MATDQIHFAEASNAETDTTTEQLIAQASAAAEQAVQLSRLAMESARLAEMLNAQVLQRTGTAVPGVEPATVAVPQALAGLATSSSLSGLSPAPGTLSTMASPNLAVIQRQLLAIQQTLGNANTSVEAPIPQFDTQGPPLTTDSEGTRCLTADGSDNSLFVPTTSDPAAPRPPRRSRNSKRNSRDRIREQFLDAGERSANERPPRRVKIKLDSRDRKRVRTPVEEEPLEWIRRRWKSVALSTGLHMIALLLLGLVTLTVTAADEPINTVIASFADEVAEVEEEVPVEQPMEEPGEQQEEETEEEPEEEPEEEEMPEEQADEMPEDAPQPEAAPEEFEPAEQMPVAPDGDIPVSEPAVDFSQVSSRSAEAREKLLEIYGGSAASESAVQRALDWFARHQRNDGSWNFNDVGQCANAGDIDNPMGATSYVLLTFLGAGQTHREGKYKASVKAALDFLIRNGRRVPAGADLRGPNCREHDNFYVQGAAATALCEAYAMSKDRRLKSAAEGAIQFICLAQDPRGGGWRYAPHEPGCTSVTGVQMLALTSAKKAGIKVAPRILTGVSHFLDSVRSDRDGSGRYGYTVDSPKYKSSTTAIALLCRMYLGWERDKPELINGIRLLDERGPYDNLYYCYYATQVMRHWGGPEWDRWNKVMRDDLVNSQIANEGAEHGSWTPRDRSDFSSAGGRLFVTCLCTLTLEVYYRYEPVYGLPEADQVVAEAAGD